MFNQVPTVEIDQVPADGPLLDVREQDEWDAGHAAAAEHIPMSELVQRLDEVEQAAKGGAQLYVICKSGGRSGQVVNYLAQHGTDAVNVAGGMGAWAAKGLPMVAKAGDPFVL
jgi:rhodanese-related sulfurtransferase